MTTRAQKGAIAMVGGLIVGIGGIYYPLLFIPAFTLSGFGIGLWCTATNDEIVTCCDLPASYLPASQHDDSVEQERPEQRPRFHPSPPPLIFACPAPSAPEMPSIEAVVVISVQAEGRPRRDSGA